MLKINRTEKDFQVSFRSIRRFNTVIAGVVEKQLSELLLTPGTRLVLDLEGIRFIDSSGFDSLLSLHKLARENQCEFRMINLSDEVEELVRLVKLDQVFQYTVAGEAQIRTLSL